MDDEPMYNDSLTIKNSIKQWLNGSFYLVDSYYKVEIEHTSSEGMKKKFLNTITCPLRPDVLIEK